MSCRLVYRSSELGYLGTHNWNSDFLGWKENELPLQGKEQGPKYYGPVFLEKLVSASIQNMILGICFKIIKDKNAENANTSGAFTIIVEETFSRSQSSSLCLYIWLC